MSNAIAQSDAEDLLSLRGKQTSLGGIMDPRLSGKYISFIYGFPDRASMPNESFAEAAAAALKEHPEWALQYGATTGVPELIDVLLSKLKRDQGIVAGRENMLLTFGSSQGLALILDLLVDPGDTIIAEAPTFLGFIESVNNVAGKLVTVPVDDEGTDVVALERELARLASEGVRPKFIYVITNFHNPTGVTTTLARRKRIVELANQYRVPIVEDDAYYDLRYEGEKVPPVYTLDKTGSTIYLGTFSKIGGAGVRIGWMVGAPNLILRMAHLKQDGANVFGNHVAATWIPEHLDKHIEKLKRIYSHRRDLMLDALLKYMPEGCHWTHPEGGFFIWLTLPESLDAGQMLAQARERGIEYLPGVACFSGGIGKNSIRLSFSFAEDDTIDRGIQILGELVQSELLEVR